MVGRQKIISCPSIGNISSKRAKRIHIFPKSNLTASPSMCLSKMAERFPKLF